MQQLLAGKTALVTGGSAGIGKAIALLFARQGAEVAIFGTNPERTSAALAEIEMAKHLPNQRIHSYLVDVSST